MSSSNGPSIDQIQDAREIFGDAFEFDDLDDDDDGDDEAADGKVPNYLLIYILHVL